MTVADFLAAASKQLSEARIETARLDCLVLLEDELALSRVHLLAHPNYEVSDKQLDDLNEKISRRAAHVPLAYIRGKAAFFGRDFIVNENVLVPRPETETIIESLQKLALPNKPTIADIGTGSGCIGITASLEIPGSAVWLFDISEPALEVARQNAKVLGAKVHIEKSNLAEPCKHKHFDVMLANLPYVPEQYDVNRAATFEPKLALFSGADGLDAYRIFWRQLASAPKKPLFVLTESLPFQHHALATIARNAGFALEQTEDFIQVFTAL